jgi:NAD(P)-dependent dehydrogenase (short-subunit alcohol dehydrogenase family)
MKSPVPNGITRGEEEPHMMLQDKVAVIHGAGSAIGGAVARAFAGADLFTERNQADRLNATFLDMDRIGVPATYTSRLRAEQGALRRSVLRVYHVQRTEFLPSAYLLIQSIVVIILTTLAFMEIEPTYEAVIILGFISFFFISLLWLLRLMDRPFHVEEHTKDDVSLFLLRRFVDRMTRSRAT